MSLAVKRVLANRALLARQLSTQSMNWWKGDTQRLLSTFNDKRAHVICSGQQTSMPVISRLSSSAAVDHKGHNHSKLWSIERYLSIGLLGVIPASFMVSFAPMDYLLALSLVIHVHWGVEAIVVDYVRPSVFGRVIPKLAVAYLYVLSILALSGLFYFNYTDVGITQAIRMIAKI